MATTKAFRFDGSDTELGIAQHADINLMAGEITVKTSPLYKGVEIVLSTDDDEGRSADIVNEASAYQSGDCAFLNVRFPRNYASGTVIMGSVSGSVNIIGGDVYVNGKRVTADTRGAMVIGGSPIKVLVRMPAGRKLTVESVSASLTAKGDYEQISVKTTSGSISVGNARLLTVNSVSGAVRVGRVTSDANIKTISGSIHVADWRGLGLVMNSVSGSVRLGDASYAPFDSWVKAKTVSGSIHLAGTRHLADVTMKTVSGPKSRS